MANMSMTHAGGTYIFSMFLSDHYANKLECIVDLGSMKYSQCYRLFKDILFNTDKNMRQVYDFMNYVSSPQDKNTVRFLKK